MAKIAFLFSGGGAQYPGMMKELSEHIPECGEVFERANDALGRKLSEVCFNGTMETLSETDTMIPAIFAADIAAFAAMKKQGIHPTVTAGFSLGEWAALVAAGVLPFEDAMRLVQLRSDAMAAATPPGGGGMAVILGKPGAYVDALCKNVTTGFVCAANYNYPGQVTVSGSNAGLAELERLAAAEGTVYKRLAVDVPSHCMLMKPAMETLGEAVADIPFAKPRYPIVSNATAEATDDPQTIKHNIIIQLVNPVRFESSIQRMLAEGVDAFVELGPGKTLAGFVRKIAKKQNANVSIGNVETLDSLNATLTLLEK